MDREEIWQAIDREREVLAGQLVPLDAEQWDTPSLCTGLSVREVLAHLTASGVLSGPRWFGGVLRARFDFDKQVAQRLQEQLGTSQAETLARFQATIGSRTSPPLPKLALLGETVVHGEDIRHPLGLAREHPRLVLEALAKYYVGTDQVVLARGRVRGLSLAADDSDFTSGTGPVIRGNTLAIIMAMTGRKAYWPQLSGPGLAQLMAHPG